MLILALFLFSFVPDWHKAQGGCDKAVSEDPFMPKYCLDRYKTQEICDKVVDDFLPALKFVLIGLWQVRWLKNFIILYSQMIYSFWWRFW